MYRFGAFQVDPRAHELRKSGIRVKIQDQSFIVLLKLLEHPGESVSREELRAALWPADTFVDFDTGLNTVINACVKSCVIPPKTLSSLRQFRNWATASSLRWSSWRTSIPQTYCPSDPLASPTGQYGRLALPSSSPRPRSLFVTFLD